MNIFYILNIFLPAVKNNNPQLKECHATGRTHEVHKSKQKQEDEDFALALKLQQQFDKERASHNDVHRKKGTVDGYLLRQSRSSSSSSS